MEIHHLTHIENLKNILEKGLKPRNKLEKNEFRNTADNKIINKREEYKSNNSNIEIKNLNDYIPFHINELQEQYRIPYNYVVCKKEGNENMIFYHAKQKIYFLMKLYINFIIQFQIINMNMSVIMKKNL